VSQAAGFGRWVACGLAVAAVCVGGCKQETVVDKKRAVDEPARVSQKAQERANKAQGPAQLEAMNWRVVAIASSFAPAGRKRIDALGDSFPWRVNVFEETGDTNYDRVELDRDRDGEIDEKWHFRQDRWEKFAGRLFWSGTAWVQAGTGEVALPKVSTATTAGEPLYKIAVEMLQHKAADHEIVDFFADHGPKVALHDDDRDAKWDRAEIDRDRDGTVDEKWLRKGDELTRRLLAEKQVFSFRAGRWVEE
jgi:hypothetical protein